MLTEIEDQRLLLLKYRELSTNTRLKIRKLAIPHQSPPSVVISIPIAFVQATTIPKEVRVMR